ncbi:MAG: hypothetical protein A2Y25_10475 [Candidatus Melainabacteria bacterium GWF2_37_15]|nr:MAG: hypothetical protein A2Y25_10475 [Candidatus Melainabacteria bacterium GWF2_37_15]
MLDRVSFSTPQYQQRSAFKGEKEIKMLVEKANKVPPDSDDITNFNVDIQRWLKDKKISKQDVLDAQKKVEGWRKQLF